HINLGRTVQGVSVLGSMENLDAVLQRLKRRSVTVNEVVVTEIAPTRGRLARIIELANAVSLRVSRIPDITEMSAVTNGLLEPRPIELGDLLERPEVNTDLASVTELIEG